MNSSFSSTLASKHAWLASLAGAALVGLAGCGGAQGTGPEAPAPAATEAPSSEAPAAPPEESAAPAAPASWAEMSKEQKGKLMQEKVMPRMAQLFQEADAKEFAKMDCFTCHGSDAKERAFVMPNPGLPKLSTTGKFEAEMRDHPDMTKFMMKVVVPEMAQLLPGVQPYNPETHQGFGCFNCHVKAE